MTKGDSGMEVLMGDLVLLEDEVNPVMSALLNNGLEVTALHNHFFFENPRLFYMHVHGHGSASELALKAKPALELIGHVPTQHKSSISGGPAPFPPVGWIRARLPVSWGTRVSRAAREKLPSANARTGAAHGPL
jgi:hypothetical protein